MDSSKLEKIENKKLPRWIRAGNFIYGIGEFFYKIETFFTAALVTLATIVIFAVFTPFKILFEIIAYLFRKK